MADTDITTQAMLESECATLRAEVDRLRRALARSEAAEVVAWASGAYDMSTEGYGDEEDCRAALNEAKSRLAALDAVGTGQ